jgi:hypothetical protein
MVKVKNTINITVQNSGDIPFTKSLHGFVLSYLPAVAWKRCIMQSRVLLIYAGTMYYCTVHIYISLAVYWQVLSGF